jgi:hypothetical protein
MNKRVRHMVTAWVALVALLALPAVGATAPVRDSASTGAFSPRQLVDELVSRLGAWLEGSTAQRVNARSGQSPEPGASPGSALESGSTVTTQGGGAMDPDGLPGPDPENGNTVTTQGGPAMDPDG